MIKKTLIICLIGLVVLACKNEAKEELEVNETTELTIDENGLVNAPAKNLVSSQCSGCHSIKLVTQNRASREGWKNMIVWMQETQNLWDLGDNEDKILDYLSTYYSPEQQGRRKNLEVEEWYTLED